ncbi:MULTISPECIES: MFS transporter [Sphingosinicellaceae]|uniref:MFS transporter n=1 Tax=Sphingosinicellaceae TaxID=2820280 RepID=UPI001C1E7703|nr:MULTISPECIES: MFS transporter [Polymorphobacter]QYE35444.1 MFS transporter [Polymorphobacter sp. PAMC 29334]UAJ11246.1 MFS transporter [Polymorphobacter megasporae]
MTPAIRSTVLACLYFAGFGCLIPFLPLWLEKVHGFSGAEIGVVLAIAGFSRALAGPLTAAWADGRSDRRAPLFMFTIVLTAGFAVLKLLTGFVAVFALILILDIAFWGLLPVVETTLLRLTRTGRPPYGVARGLASAAFVAGTTTVGFLNDATQSYWPIWAFLLVISAAMIAWSALMPREPVLARAEKREPFGERLAAGLGMLRNPEFTLFIFAAGLIQASAAFLYTAGSLVWTNVQHFSGGTIAMLWNIGTLAEVGFLIFLGGWSARFRPESLIVAGGVGAVIRWTALAMLPPLWILIPLQLLHALSFAATFLGGMRFIQTLFGDDRTPTAQMIYMGLANAPTYAAAVLLSGPLYDRIGAPGYLAMTGVAGLGLVLAIMLRARTAKTATVAVTA